MATELFAAMIATIAALVLLVVASLAAWPFYPVSNSRALGALAEAALVVTLVVFPVSAIWLLASAYKDAKKHGVTFGQLGRMSRKEREDFWVSKGEPRIDRSKPWWKRVDED